MSVSARLGTKMQLALARYCKAHGLTKTQALERGIALLLQHDGPKSQHPSYIAFERLREHLEDAATPEHPSDSISSLKERLDEKYPG